MFGTLNAAAAWLLNGEILYFTDLITVYGLN